MPQRVGNQGRLLGGVALGKSGRRRSGRGTAGIAGALALVAGLGEAFLQLVLDEMPGAIVLRLLLRPDQLLELGHRRQALDQRLAREGIELLHADDFGRRVASRVARLHQFIGKLARAEHYTPRLARRGRIEVAEDPTEMALADEIVALADCQLVPEQRLRRHHHQRLAEIAQHLAPEDVEIVGRRGAIGDLDIILGAKLEITLQAGGSYAPAPGPQTRAAAA